MKRFISAAIAVIIAVAAFSIDISAVSSAAYTVIEASTGRILYSQNGQKQMPMASTTKVMTAVLVIENLPLEAEYDIPDQAVGIEGSSIYLKRGERLTGEELLYGLMLASGNDAAYALAILTGGSIENFLLMMNSKASALQLKNTKFADPCGLKSTGHYTTSEDLSRLCAYAMQLPLFKKIVATENYQIRGAEEGTVRYLHNKNRILSELTGGDGIKTGYTRAAGRCLCASATRNGMQLICVVLNDYDWFEDSKQLLEKGFSEFSMVQLAKKDEFLCSVNIFGGKKEKCDIMYQTDVFYPLKKGERVTAISGAKDTAAPVSLGDKAGTAEFYLSGKKIAEVNTVYKESIDKKFSFFGG